MNRNRQWQVIHRALLHLHVDQLVTDEELRRVVSGSSIIAARNAFYRAAHAAAADGFVYVRVRGVGFRVIRTATASVVPLHIKAELLRERFGTFEALAAEAPTASPRTSRHLEIAA